MSNTLKLVARVVFGFFLGFVLTYFPLQCYRNMAEKAAKVKINHQEKLLAFKDINPQYDNIVDATVMISIGAQENHCPYVNPLEDCVGTGVIVKYDKKFDVTYILTNRHVANADIFSECKAVVVKVNSDKVYNAEIVSASSWTDLALVKVKGFVAKPVELADNRARLLDEVIAFGCPTCYRYAVTVGYMVKHKYDYILDTQAIELHLGVDGGSSGSGVYNSKGKLVGLIFAKVVSMTDVPISFMVPLDHIKQFLKEMGLR